MKTNLAVGIKRRMIGFFACFGCCCGFAVADFAESTDVKGMAVFADAMMSKFRSLKPDSESFVSYGRRGAVPLSEMVSIGTENKKLVVYVQVFHEISKDHGDRANDLRYVREFPIKDRVEKPVLSFRLDASKVAKLAEWPSSISMICPCVRERETKKLTWSASYLRLAFNKEKDMEDFLKSLSSLLFDEKNGKGDGYVTLTHYPF